MKKYIIIIGLLFTANILLAQQVDQQKMEKDLKVAQTVLKSLVNENQRSHWNNHTNGDEAQYIEGFGVILNLPANNMVFYEFSPELPPMPDFSEAIVKGMEAVERLELIIEEEEEEEIDNQEREAERQERRKELQERQQELEQRAHTIAKRARAKVMNTDSIREVRQEQKIESIKSFLLDYGHLISQVKDEEKILVMEKGNHHRFYYNSQGVDARKRGKLSAEITMKDIKAYQSGKIDRKEAESRITINLGNEDSPLAKDLALLQSILQRLYQSDLSETYYVQSPIFHEQIEGMGVIFYMDMVSSIQAGKDLWRVPTQQKESLNQQQRDDLVKKLYPQFEAELKANILEYGKNITSLKDNEQLIFKVAITKCTDCGIPENLELQINGKVLKELKSGKLDEKQALQQLKITQGEMQ
ncbi:hypothetical protein JKA74_09240 [Marivirga sp. S37H4]|uniref:Uncharacterized protein n=1 Tax=Marivirga aurantiaca TaxID=2802615 RepID=A0A934WYI9_9BACT|nr:hypothetical protein [Marivirga aurantiaca]MBK6265222.1 hypothetical protein [Marivirga aurantiaca]